LVVARDWDKDLGRCTVTESLIGTLGIIESEVTVDTVVKFINISELENLMSNELYHNTLQFEEMHFKCIT
jgi:hypothetical protein